MNLEQTVEDFAVHTAHSMTFREVKTTTHSLISVTLSADEDVSNPCIVQPRCMSAQYGMGNKTIMIKNITNVR